MKCSGASSIFFVASFLPARNYFWLQCFFLCAIFVYNTKIHYLCPDNIVCLEQFFIITLLANSCNALSCSDLYYDLGK